MVLFIVGLVVSGVTAFPLLLELRILANCLGLLKQIEKSG
jgi:hypothetical protein